VLTFQQEYVFEQLKTISKKGFSANLLAGVTGSGKTEVYMQLAERVVREGKAVLVLVPEIALISQTERRFRARFGEKVAVLHSGLTSGERFDQWMRIVKGEVPIAIGARSAVFAPFDKIGLIVVDEEHDTAYKQETGLRYNARDLAVIRAKMQNCPVLLGSATPSMQSCYNVTIGKFSELQLNQRVEKRPLPEITVVDLRHCRKIRKGGGLISETLYEAIRDALGRKEQVLLFLNRRGFATISLCKGCGEVFRCPRCDISLTLHKACGQYRCHLCGYRKGSTSRCVSCGSGEIGHLGMGTEKVEAIIASLFPGARTARMDRDTIKGKGSLISLLKDIRKNSVDILIGTQMVAKGHDFPGITLVGVLCADLSLGFPDFRAAEFTFQLLAQVAGRSGRGDTPGKVVLQTYNPNHYSISAAKHQDYRMFYDLEIGFRQGLNYPPFSRLVRLIISGKNAEKTKKAAEEIGGFLENMKRSDLDVFGSVEILGPIKSYLSKISNYHRRQVLLKCATVKPLKQILVSLMESEFRFSRNREAQITLDVDPISML
jgi:primosomal protein N' (replication factor Y)